MGTRYLTPIQKEAILRLDSEGATQTKIAQVIQTTQSTVSKFLSRLQTSPTSTQPSRVEANRNRRLLSDRDKRSLIRYALLHPWEPISTLSRAEIYGKAISRYTTRRILKEYGI